MEARGELRTPYSRGKSPGANWIAGWVGPKVEKNILPLPGVKPKPSSPWPLAIPTGLSRAPREEYSMDDNSNTDLEEIGCEDRRSKQETQMLCPMAGLILTLSSSFSYGLHLANQLN
jgi:hypothetical protein